ncbi:hypothetical protein AWZ03_001687 [Drosophila navojoa]|uniref:Uncharacterized protein n=1 Tax=Drosophila navojoa TaxID=7232 RepID=A0A484BTA2_DRONA|nr:hypothetical protein AWZ03_001687 [Drosophila navojoa]
MCTESRGCTFICSLPQNLTLTLTLTLTPPPTASRSLNLTVNRILSRIPPSLPPPLPHPPHFDRSHSHVLRGKWRHKFKIWRQFYPVAREPRFFEEISVFFRLRRGRGRGRRSLRRCSQQ